MKLIVGLGNPGKQYAHTRHNLGFMVLQSWASHDGIDIRKSPVGNGLLGKTIVDGQTCSLFLPATFMNNSGEAVKAFINKQAIDISDVLVVYDDMSLAYGHMRLKPDGSAGGHNGMKSLIAHLGSNEFARLRLGIGRPRGTMDPADYVLNDFTSAEQKLLPDFINQALACVHSWVTRGVEATMNQFNQRKMHESL